MYHDNNVYLDIITTFLFGCFLGNTALLADTRCVGEIAMPYPPGLSWAGGVPQLAIRWLARHACTTRAASSEVSLPDQRIDHVGLSCIENPKCPKI